MFFFRFLDFFGRLWKFGELLTFWEFCLGSVCTPCRVESSRVEVDETKRLLEELVKKYEKIRMKYTKL